MGDDKPNNKPPRFSEPVKKSVSVPPPPPDPSRTGASVGPPKPPGVPRQPTNTGPRKPGRAWLAVGAIAGAAVFFTAGFLAGANLSESKTGEYPTPANSSGQISKPSQPSETPSIEPSSQASPESSLEPSIELGPLYDVLSVTDGDTFRVDYEGYSEPVRLIGIDTPESVNQTECFGPEASRFTKKALEGKRVYLVRDGMQDDRDRYGRLLRFVFLEDKSNFNVTLVREGFAEYMSKYPVADPFRSELSSAQDFASQNAKGMWKAC